MKQPTLQHPQEVVLVELDADGNLQYTVDILLMILDERAATPAQRRTADLQLARQAASLVTH